MDKAQKELTKTYFHARNSAQDTGMGNLKYGAVEIKYLLKNKILTPEETKLKFKNGLAKVNYNNEEMGWLDTEGNPFPKDGRRFSYVNNFKDGIAVVGINGRLSLINTEGNQIPKDGKTFRQIDGVFGGYAKVQYDDYSWGLIDTEGNPFPKNGETFIDISHFSNGFVKIVKSKEGKMGWLDTEGNSFPKGAGDFRIATIKDNLLFSNTSNILNDTKFQVLRYDNGRYGFYRKDILHIDNKPIPKNGKTFKNVSSFKLNASSKEKVALVQYDDNRYGFIDTNGNPFPNGNIKFDEIISFVHNFFFLKIDNNIIIYDYKQNVFYDKDKNPITIKEKYFKRQ